MHDKLFLLSLLVHVCFFIPTEEPQKKLPAPVGVESLSGIYHVQGTENGKPYEGAAVVQQVREIYVVRWLNGNTMGVGRREGDTLSVGWKSEVSVGVTVYQIQAGPKLVGRWVGLPGSGGTNHETLTRLKEFPDE